MNSNQSDPSTPGVARAASSTPRESDDLGGETPQIKSTPNSSSRKPLVDPPPVVVLVDVSHTESAKLSALVQVLSTATDLFRSSYPMKIRSVVISAQDSTQFTSAGEPEHHEDPQSAGGPPEPTTAANPQLVETKKPEPPKKPFAFVASLFNNKKAIPSRASQLSADNSAPTASGGGTTNSNNNNNNNVGSRMWLSVMISTWKLRFLPPTVRARTTIANFNTVVDSVRLTRLLLTSTRSQPQQVSPPVQNKAENSP